MILGTHRTALGSIDGLLGVSASLSVGHAGGAIATILVSASGAGVAQTDALVAAIARRHHVAPRGIVRKQGGSVAWLKVGAYGGGRGRI